MSEGLPLMPSSQTNNDPADLDQSAETLAHETTRPDAPTSVIGSVRARANKYRPCWNEADPWSRGLQDGQHGRGPPEEEQSASVGGHVLVMAGAEADEVAQFIVGLAEPGG